MPAADASALEGAALMEFLPHQRAMYWAIRSGKYRELWSYGAIRTGKSVAHGAGLYADDDCRTGPVFRHQFQRGQCVGCPVASDRAFAARAGVKARRVRGEAAYIGLAIRGRGWWA